MRCSHSALYDCKTDKHDSTGTTKRPSEAVKSSKDFNRVVLAEHAWATPESQPRCAVKFWLNKRSGRTNTCSATSGISSNKVLYVVTLHFRALVDMCVIASKRATDHERKVAALQNQVQSLEDILSWVPPLINSHETGSNPSPENLDTTCRCLGSFATKLRKSPVAD